MTEYRHITSENLVQRQDYEFDAVDTKGRRWGYRIIVREHTYTADENGKVPGLPACRAEDAKRFWARTHMTRDGMPYGGTPVVLLDDTLDGVMTKAMARMEKARAKKEA